MVKGSQNKFYQSPALLSLLQLLKKQGKHTALIDALETGSNYYPALWLSSPVNAQNNSWLQLQEGIGMPLIDSPVVLDYSTYLNEVVMPIVNTYKNTHPNHPFDDRKFRLSNYFVAPEGTIHLTLGPTVYQHYRTDIERPIYQAIERMLQGMQDANDPFYYFSKMMGITVIILSKEGYVFLGERASHIDTPGLLQFIAGAATFHADLSQVNFWDDIQAEVLQETGWDRVLDQPTLYFIGISGHTFTSELDLMFVIPTALEATYFEHPRLCEHERMFCVQTAAQAMQLLQYEIDYGSKLLYPTCFGLKYLLQHYWKKG